MYADKKIGMCFVGDFGTTVEFNKFVALAGIDNLHVGEGFGNVFPCFQSNCQNNVLLARGLSKSTRIFPAMTGIEHHASDFTLFHLGKTDALKYNQDQ